MVCGQRRPLEVVLTAITEQEQVFEGAAHPFYWRPKLRIPDIYENEPNKMRFAAFLDACLSATREDQVLAEMSRLAAAHIKGLGPAVANIVYFLHPTIVPPSTPRRAICSPTNWEHSPDCCSSSGPVGC